ncbi:hypothetical protein GGR58DRAFT_523857 [Xylaria digitata]|nr:hypothetical protein GGR58DRAFT_523857 [Xylaria digitata]
MEWLPYTLQWPCFLAIIAFACLLEIAVVTIHSISWRNSGLVADDGSGILQIGSKFVPTLLATIYVFLASVLLDDVKRTEPFARLSSPAGAQADLSVSWTADAWWDALISSFPRHHNRTNWAMLCATLAFILGFLIISPLSSSLIVSQTVVPTQQTRPLQLEIGPSMLIQAQPLSETYYRSIGSVLRNATTSAWIPDQYAVVPFWPASFQTIPLGPILFDTDQTWTATTSVFSTELICEPLKLTNLSDTSLPSISEGDLSFIPGRNATVSSRGDCTLFFLSPVLTLPETIITGEACEALYFQGDTMVTASLVDGESIVKIDEQQYHANRRPISPAAANISTFQNAFLSTDWNIHLSASDITKYSHQPKNLFVGPGNLLGALYDFSPDKMTADTAEQRRNIIQRIKGRFFGELLRDCFNSNRLHDPAEIPGVINTSPRRLVVVSAVAITLEVIFFIVLALLSVTFLLTRPTRRPLNLDADPASAMSIAKLLSDDPDTIRGTSLNNTSTKTQIQRERRPTHGPTDPNGIEKSTVFGTWPLILLVILLTTVMIVILTHYIYSQKHKLYQKAFVYTTSVSFKGLNLGDVNPASIATTLVAVIIGLWWGSIDTNLCRAQPFLALAMGPVTGSKGVSISYRSSYLLWASIRAVRRKHWLFLVCTGAFLSQILTVAMSSLWSRQPGVVSVNMEIPKRLELRHVPILSKGQVSRYPAGLDRRSAALSDLFGNLRASWMYGAAVQLSLNGPEPPWSSQGWNFVPVDLALANLNNISIQSALDRSDSIDRLLTKVTLETSAIRGRLDCSEYSIPDNPELWMINWALSSDPNAIQSHNISYGYELRNYLYMSNSTLFEDSGTPRTTLFSSDRRLKCCQNITNGNIGQSSIGYWSPYLKDSLAHYPAISETWPANFTVKWIRGHAVGVNLSYSHPYGPSTEDVRLIWTERPRMTALNCMPTIETTNASVTVDATNGRVIKFELLGQLQKDEFAWNDDFLAYKQPSPWDSVFDVNMTTSHGILFILGILGAADLENLIGATSIASSPGSDTWGQVLAERLQEQTFNIRDPGLNVDYMTYAMLSPANNNHSALLNAGTLRETAQQTFSVFFQHFVNNEISMTSGGYLYQSLDEKLPADLGEPVPLKGSHPEDMLTTGSSNNGNSTNRITNVSVSQPMEVLSMSEPAAWVCMLILGYLIITCILLAVASKRYNRLLLRQVNSIADIAFLVAGSHKLLRVARDRSLESLKYDDTVEVKLDWFVTDQGCLRWGIEVVDELDPTVSLTPLSTRESDVFLDSDENADAEEDISWHDTVVSQIMAVGR